MKGRRRLLAAALALATFSVLSAGKLSLPYPPQGELGYVSIDPYKVSPLTAIIDLGGKNIADVKVKVHGKGKGGVDIEYDVGPTKILTYNGVPIVGLYPSHKNKVSVSYTVEGTIKNEEYTILTAGLPYNPVDGDVRFVPEFEPVTVADNFKDRLYFFNLMSRKPEISQFRWGSDGGAAEWDTKPLNVIADTNGDIRWMLDPNSQHDEESVYTSGVMIGTNQAPDGMLITGQGQRLFKFDLLGRHTMVRRLPRGFQDYSHDLEQLKNGNFIVRVAKRDYVRDDGVVVNTVRDHVIEIDRDGNVLDVWDFNKILDPYRDNLLLALDVGAVCLNVDTESEGETLEDLDKNAPFGDIPGVGPGRNWAHINSVQYSYHDDSIIVSARHQGTIKVGRDKQVKWILAPSEGWTGDLASKVLTPVDAKGNNLKCDNGKCEGEFDWPWTQHTSYIGKTNNSVISFDNGDGRGFEQPAFPTDKFSRAVQYEVNEADMTVQQVWQYGEERGYEWYSPITSLTQYFDDKDSMVIFSASRGLFDRENPPELSLVEMEYEGSEVFVEMNVKMPKLHAPGYRAWPISIDAMFGN
ncbi:aryl-sulfate sulfotransferase [Ferrimonas pelagia]|uniref:Aryl-sulfate sulfotransferase n=1 Tax=Ferrimonas pelagia TaxID=1177826 RepID=A0ABP9ESG1_9GAMM